LHTNGYSLARAVLLDKAGLMVSDSPEELGGASVADALLAVHKSYLNDVRAIWEAHGRPAIHGLAHITGGGFYDNIPRVLPEGLSVVLDPSAWEVLPIFRLIQSRGEVSDGEMHRVFNMGIGLVVVVPKAVDLGALPGLGARLIGEVTVGETPVVLPF
jgi:phosphoribosylformylglycinamidine cyclo-ligase